MDDRFALRDGCQKLSTVALVYDAIVENQDCAAIGRGANQTPDALLELENRLRELVLQKRISTAGVDGFDSGFDHGVVGSGERELDDDDVLQGVAAHINLAAGAQDNPFLQTLNQALEDNPLPPFAVIRKYLAPTGSILRSDDSGFHYIGFSLRRK